MGGGGSKIPLEVTKLRKESAAHLAVVAPQVEVNSLWRVPVPAAVAGGEGHAHDAAAVACGQPALLIVAPPTHRFLLLALGDAPLPGQAEDVRVAAEHRPLLHRCIHTSSSDSRTYRAMLSAGQANSIPLINSIFVVGLLGFSGLL